MRALFPLFISLLLTVHVIWAQQPAGMPGNLAFNGTGPSETTVFAVKERWQVHYAGPPASISVEDANGAALSGMGVGVNGTLYMAAPGSYKVRVVPNLPGTAVASWHLDISQVGTAGQVVSIQPEGYAPPDMTASVVSAPTLTSPGTTITGAPVQAPAAAAGTPGVTAVSVAPAGTQAPAAMLNSSGQAKMTDAQVAALVLIKGDNGEGTGFLVKTPAGPVVVTNQHVIGANPHLQITTTGGTAVKPSGLKIAGDRDLAMIPVQDGPYSYLEMATPADIASSVQVGDAVITPGNSQGGGVMLPCNGVVRAMGPVKVEVSNQFYHGNSGGPILHAKSGKVIGVVTEAQQVDVSNALDKASYNSGASGINSAMRYFGLRLDNVGAWNDFAWSKFENETEFLREFHERSKCLDSYLNTGTRDTSEAGTYFARDEKIKEANSAYGIALSGNVDNSQRVEAARNLIFTLDAVADAQMDQIDTPTNFSSYNQQEAKDESGYRKALKKEIADMSSDVERLSGLARPTN